MIQHRVPSRVLIWAEKSCDWSENVECNQRSADLTIQNTIHALWEIGTKRDAGSWSYFDDSWLLCSRLVHPPLKASEIPFDNVNFFVIPQLVCRVLFSPFFFSRCIAVEFETGASLAAFCMCSAAVGLAVCCSLQARPMLQAAGASLVQWLPEM